MAKSNPSLMVSAAGIFLNFASVLDEELKKAGGFPGMLYFAQKEHARPMMELLAKTIVESKLWKVPKSLILAEIAENAPPELVSHWQSDFWTDGSKLADNLTTLRFASNITSCGYTERYQEGIPNVGRHEGCGDVVVLDNRKYVVTLSDGSSGLCLAPAEWIDLDS